MGRDAAIAERDIVSRAELLAPGADAFAIGLAFVNEPVASGVAAKAVTPADVALESKAIGPPGAAVADMTWPIDPLP